MFLFRRHRWRGESRASYRFRILLTDKAIANQGGIYIFVRRRYIFWLEPLYVGKAANLKSRLKGHERWPEAYWRGHATEKHVLIEGSEDKRRKIEEDLIRALSPIMNRMLKPNSSEDAPNNPDLAKRWGRRVYWKKT